LLTDILIRLFIKDKDNIKDKHIRQKYGYLGGFVGVVCNVIPVSYTHLTLPTTPYV
jgi:hypothetical protein